VKQFCSIKLLSYMDLIAIIAKQLKENNLPGESAQLRMAHAFRRKPWPAPPSALKAGVMVLFYPKEESWHLVFIERASRNAADVHKGQISFPGGRMDPSDEDLIYCAIRETEEEVGVDRKAINVLGQLTPLYIPVSNFLVHPVVGFTENEPEFRPQVQEVKSILEVPFDHFKESRHIKQMDMMFGSGMVMEEVPYFDAMGNVIWGATAMILSELLALLEENKGPMANLL